MKLNKRQKIFLFFTILALIYIVWELYSIFIKNSDSANVPVSTSQKQVIVEVNPSNVPSSLADAKQPGATEAYAPPQKKNIDELSGASENQKTPVSQLMKQYEELQTQQTMLQEKIAIAEMKQKIADLRIKLSQVAPDMATDSNGNGQKIADYKLVYIDYQGDRWAATLSDLSKGGILKEVAAGTRLSDDTKVLAVDSNGVKINQGGKKILLTFNGSVSIGDVDTGVSSKTEKIFEPKIIPKEKAVISKKITRVKKVYGPKKPKISKTVSVKAVKGGVLYEAEKLSKEPKKSTKVEQIQEIEKPKVEEPITVTELIGTNKAEQITSKLPESVKNNMEIKKPEVSQPITVTELIGTNKAEQITSKLPESVKNNMEIKRPEVSQPITVTELTTQQSKVEPMVRKPSEEPLEVKKVPEASAITVTELISGENTSSVPTENATTDLTRAKIDKIKSRIETNKKVKKTDSEVKKNRLNAKSKQPKVYLRTNQKVVAKKLQKIDQSGKSDGIDFSPHQDDSSVILKPEQFNQ